MIAKAIRAIVAETLHEIVEPLVYAEATELSLRAGDAGWSTIYNPDARGRVPGPLAVAARYHRSSRR